ncbi:AraC family transcriptional regulator [Sphingomonas colocasiae]|uniref:AraC family transcriptional regulator n=1 Tax=Sphingomonas colocasiae TaxID=1848973 RepID=A0ABS7PU30_9SPHN|nr:AraC family transcriptional regulator [Sphingomonas colocasiae]MBY8823907.1 AraC family transcriptional regulator [Sphingomonas colocasiae]
MDPLSDIIALLRPHTALSKPIEGRGDWAVRYAAYGQPGFALVLDGSGWLTLEGCEPVRLDRGDFVLLPATPAFELASRTGIAAIPVEPTASAVRHGDADGPPDLRMLGGSFQIEPANAAMLATLLPALIHVRADRRDTDRLARIATLVIEECADDRPGGAMILARLIEVMLVEVLRHEAIGRESHQAGLLAALRDPAIARVMQAIHADVRGRWTVTGLAGIARMSRSAFAARFADTVGCGPIEYLLRWRMALAKEALSRGGTSLDRIAEEIGYESASAFSTAFRRRIGCAPGAFARGLAAGA